MLRRLAKIEMFSDGSKNLETEVFQLGHGIIISPNSESGEHQRFLGWAAMSAALQEIFAQPDFLSRRLSERIGSCLMLADDRCLQLTGRSLQVHTAVV